MNTLEITTFIRELSSTGDGRVTLFFGIVFVGFLLSSTIVLTLENRRITKLRKERIARGEEPDHWTDLYD